MYCASGSGLGRGFTLYQDYIFPELTAFKMAVLVDRVLHGFQTIVTLTEDWIESAGLLAYLRRLWQSLDFDRKGAAVVNRELLDWLTRRTQPKRPFFAFLNYCDAHDPYRLLPERLHRFGVEPPDRYHRLLIQNWWDIDKTALRPNDVSFAAAAYDDCIADLDEQLGILIDELDGRGVLNHSWLMIVSDHGESFGEHAGIFCHGTSLYDTELRVHCSSFRQAATLRRSRPSKRRSVCGTWRRLIVDVAGLEAGAPIPGGSPAPFWKQPGPDAPIQSPVASAVFAEMVPSRTLNRDSGTVSRQLTPLGAVKERDWSYIRREGDVREELFHLRIDANEQNNLARDPSAQTTLEQMRAALERLTEGPLRPERFNP